MSALGATGAERRQRVVGALDASGWNVTAAAGALGVSRKHLHTFIKDFGLVRPAEVTPAAPAAPAPDKPVMVQLGLPRALKDWLETRALARKHAGARRFAISPVVVEILEAAMAAEERERR